MRLNLEIVKMYLLKGFVYNKSSTMEVEINKVNNNVREVKKRTRPVEKSTRPKVYVAEQSITVERKTNVTNRDDNIRTSLLNFFSDLENANRMIPIITHQENEVSLRVLDWFVTNYAKRYHVVYVVETLDDKEERFDVFRSYKSQLKAFSKKRFDPFRRKHKEKTDADSDITLYYEMEEFGKPETKDVLTRIRQMNFFRWAILNGVLEYVEEHLDVIEEDMISANSKKRKVTGKKQNLSITAARTFTKKYSKITVEFE